nr:hypothetical protein [Tanacetum cinerariifolium]
AFATIINKCLSGKEIGIDKIRLSCAQILSDPSILRRNKMFWHTARDDTQFTSMRCISIHEDTQQQQKTFGTDEGTGTIPGVSDVPPYESENHTKYEEEDLNDKVHTPSDYELTDEEKLDDEEKMDDKEDGEVIKELYDNVNVNLGNDDTEITDVDQGASEQQNSSQKSGFDSSDSSDFTSKLINLENPSPMDNEIALLMQTSAPHATAIPEITSGFTTTTPPPPLFFNPLLQKQTPTFTTTISINPTVYLPEIPNFASVFKFDQRMKEAVDVAVQLQINKIQEEAYAKNQEFLNQKNLYNALVESYNSDKDIITSYGDVVLLKRGQDNQDKDEDPSAGLDRGTKRRKSGKDTETSKDSRSKENKSSTTSKDASQSQHKYSCKSVHAGELSHTVEDSDMQQDQEFVMGDNDEQPTDKEVTKADLTIMKKYENDHLEEIKVHGDDQQLYTFKEGDFKRLRLQEIEDMLLLLVQQKLTNLTIDELNEMLNDVRTTLHDIAMGITIEYLPMRKLSDLDKKRARVMVQDIDKQLYHRRLMRNLEMFVGRRIFRKDLRLLERTI